MRRAGTGMAWPRQGARVARHTASAQQREKIGKHLHCCPIGAALFALRFIGTRQALAPLMAHAPLLHYRSQLGKRTPHDVAYTNECAQQEAGCG